MSWLLMSLLAVSTRTRIYFFLRRYWCLWWWCILVTTIIFATDIPLIWLASAWWLTCSRPRTTYRSIIIVITNITIVTNINRATVRLLLMMTITSSNWSIYKFLTIRIIDRTIVRFIFDVCRLLLRLSMLFIGWINFFSTFRCYLTRILSWIL
jgi:hypothetical protein